MNKLLMILTIAITMVVAKPGHGGHKGGKPLNKGSVNSSLKGANSVVKPNKVKKHGSRDILDIDKQKHKMERKATKKAIKTVL